MKKFFVLSLLNIVISAGAGADIIRPPHSYPLSPEEISRLRQDEIKFREQGGYKCHSGVAMEKEQEQNLKDLEVQIDTDKFILPISNPRSILEAGDILVFYKDEEDSEGALELLLSGMTHSAIAYKDREGVVQILESPKSYSARLGRNSFHILRIRRFPAALEKDPTFKGEPRSEVEKTLIDGWTYDRARRLKKINYLANQLAETKYSFNPLLETPALSSKQLPMLEAEIEMKDGANLNFYCAELVYTINKLAGITVARPRDSLSTLSYIDQYVYPYFQSKNPTATAHVLHEIIFDDLFSHRKALGVSEKVASLLKEKFVTLLDAPMVSRKDLLAHGVGLNILSFVAPSDIFNSIYYSNSDLQYLGTVVRGGCKGPQPEKKVGFWKMFSFSQEPREQSSPNSDR